jgi:hypothetical protein
MFNVGDRVKIKRDLIHKRFPGDPGLNDDMLTMQGKECTIHDVWQHDGNNYYYLSDTDWTWVEDWLELAFEDAKIEEVEENDFMELFK